MAIYVKTDARTVELLNALAEIQGAKPIATIEVDDYVQQWIPCSEKLPSQDGEYLVTVYCTKDITWVDKFEYFITDDGWVDPSNAIDWNGYVTAWMPLPQPWKGENNE